MHVVDLGGGTHDGRDGLVRFELEIAGNATKALCLSYRLEAASRVSLNL